MGLMIDAKVLGPLQTNIYLLRSDGDAAIVDPAMAAGGMPAFLAEREARITKILLTHAHGDHIGGVGEIKQAFPDAISYCPAADEEMLQSPEANLSAVFGLAITAPPADELLHPPTELAVGDTLWQVLATPGHSPGGVTFYCSQHDVALTGDALFCGGIGRTGFPGGDQELLLQSIHRVLLTLPDRTRVLPGHGPETTIGAERKSNPFLQNVKHGA